MTLNYLKPFEPGEPIDINVLNKLIMNVNFLSSQIAQIYRLPAVQAPVTLSGVAVGGTSGTGGSTAGSETVSPVDVVTLTIPYKADFRKQGQTLTYTLSSATVEATTKKTVKSFKILNVGYNNPMYVPKKYTTETNKSATSTATLKVSNAGNVVTFVQGKTSTWAAGTNGPMTSGSAPNYYLYFNFIITVEVTY